MSLTKLKTRLSFPILGEQVTLNPFTPHDITEEYLGWLNDSDVVKYSNQRFNHHTFETAKRYMESFKGSNNHFLSVRRKQDQSFIGTMTIYCSLPHKTADIGIMIGEKKFWGMGLGKDAWIAVMDWLASSGGFRKITGGTLKCNVGMIQIMLAAGMIPDGVRAQQEIVEGSYQDILHYAKFT